MNAHEHLLKARDVYARETWFKVMTKPRPQTGVGATSSCSSLMLYENGCTIKLKRVGMDDSMDFTSTHAG